VAEILSEIALATAVPLCAFVEAELYVWSTAGIAGLFLIKSSALLSV
jgi:hypothetical protein